MNTHNSSNNFGNNVHVTQACDTYTYFDNVNHAISDQQPNASPHYNQQYLHNVVSSNQQQQDDAFIQQQDYGNDVTISLDRQPMPNINVTQQPSPNHNQQYQQSDVTSPNHQQQYDALNSIHNHNYLQQPTISNINNTVTTPSHNHNHQQPMFNTISNNNVTTDNSNHPDSNNNHHHHNNQQSTSSNASPPLFSPQSNIFPLSLSITINSPQTNFIIIPNSDIQQVLACLNNPSLANTRF